MNHIPHELEPEHFANFTKLADFLAALPVDYKYFHMGSYAEARVEDPDNPGFKKYAYFDPKDVDRPTDEWSCSTTACALGHGPAAGVHTPHLASFGWASYAEVCFGTSVANDTRPHVYGWCFSGLWDTIDDTPQGAALRIRYMLRNGLPEDHEDQLNGEADYLFKKGA